MICLSYSLFGDPSSFEFSFYLRGLIFNVRMNRILYPGFTTSIAFQKDLIENKSIKGIIEWLFEHESISYKPFEKAPRCESMLMRMSPIFEDLHPYENATHVICRDLDSVSTYREALCTYEWLNSGLPFHAINDNAAHGGLMGGMVAFKSEDFKQATGYKSFEQMIKGLDLRKHGSDQNFLNKFVLPKIKNKLFLHNLKGAGCQAAVTKTVVPASGPVDKKYQYSDLISRYIGSAGVIDFELLRWFKTHDPNPKWDAFEKRYSDVCYWAR